MKNLAAIKDQLRFELPQKGISYVIKTLEELLPGKSPKYDLLLSLKADYRKLKLEVLDGVLSKEEENRQIAQIRRRLLNFLQELEPEDFDKKARRSQLAPEQKIKKGHVLYRIPKEMQLEQESRCLVRIAFDKEMIVEDLDLDENTELRSGVRISDYMKVEVVDPSPDGVFDIRTTSESVQLIDADDFTEWKFYVKPLQAGEHVLELKVNIMLQIDGEVRVREKTLEESVVIITEAPPQPADAMPWQTFEEGLAMPCVPEVIAPRSVRLPGGLRYFTVGLVMLIGLGTTAYAMDFSGFREEVDWFRTRYIENEPEAYEAFIESYPKSPKREKATYKKADVLLQQGAEQAAEAALAKYAQIYPAGQYITDALWKLANLSQLPEDYRAYLELPGAQQQEAEATQALQQLEPKVWEEVQSSSNPLSIDRYLRLYPQGKHRAKAIEKLVEPSTWQSGKTYELPARIRPDTAEVVNRLLQYTRESHPELIDKLQPLLETSPILRPTAVLVEQRGIVLSVDTGEPVSGAEVEASGIQNGVIAKKTTDGKGRFIITAYPVETEIELAISAEGYRDTTYTRKVSNEQMQLYIARAKREANDSGGQEELPSAVKDDPKLPTSRSEAEVPLGDFPLPEMVRVPGGDFLMGDVMGDNEFDREKPVHPVTLSSYEIGRYEVTFAQYDAFCEASGRDKPDDRGRGRRPVINVSWYDAVAYCNWLSEQRGYEPVYELEGEEVKSVNWKANGYRLPTEAEWEYAARGGGKKVRFGNGKDIARASEINFNASEANKEPYSEVGQYRRETVPVGSLNSPNGLGLHDMSGNVLEWCWDWYGSDYYSSSPEQNPRGPDSGSRRVYRGGSWGDYPRFCRAAYRGSIRPSNRGLYLGFRVARSSRR